VSLFADSLGDLGWLNGNLYLSKFITSGNTAARSYTFPNATCNIPDDSLVVHLAGTETITGAKTFSGGVTFTSSLTTTSNVTFSNSGFTLVLQPPTLSVNRTVTLPNGTGTLALTSDISYPVTSVFGRTGAIVATSGDYTTAQVTESGNLYFTDSRARLAISLTTTGTSGAATYNNTTGVLNIPQYADQFVGTVTSVAALTIGTSGTDLSSTVATSTTTPVITLNVPTASATNRGALSSTDWTTFNNKQATLSLTTTGTSGVATLVANTLNVPNYGSGAVTGSGSTNTISKFTASNTIGNSLIADDGTYVGINGSVSSHIFQIYSSGFNYARVGLTNTSTGNTASDGLIFQQETINSIIKNQENGYLAFGVNGAETNLVIAQGGNVLINTTTDAGYKLDVNGTGRFTRMIVGGTATSRILQVNTSGNDGIRILTSGDNPTLDLMQTAAANASARNWRIVTNWEGWGTMDFQSGTNNTNDPSTTRLSISGNTGAATFSSSVTATSFFESSDSRLKTLIQDNYQTKGIASITPKLYTKNGKVELGYYAQDFVGILDSAVSKGSDDMLSLSYREVLVAKVYALEQEIKELKAK
jgi:hypothetical protein